MSMQVALRRFVFELASMVFVGSIVDEATCNGVRFFENFKLARPWIEYWQGGRCACTGTSIITLVLYFITEWGASRRPFG
jgi:hypothetical protein